MGEIRWIRISITPSYFSTPTEQISQCEIIVKSLGKPDVQFNEMISDTDFQSRFDWFMEQAARLIKDQLK